MNPSTPFFDDVQHAQLPEFREIKINTNTNPQNKMGGFVITFDMGTVLS